MLVSHGCVDGRRLLSPADPPRSATRPAAAPSCRIRTYLASMSSAGLRARRHPLPGLGFRRARRRAARGRRADPLAARRAARAREELTVTEICRVIGQSQPRISRHLRLLVDAGILERAPRAPLSTTAWPRTARGASSRIARRAHPAERPDASRPTWPRSRGCARRGSRPPSPTVSAHADELEGLRELYVGEVGGRTGAARHARRRGRRSAGCSTSAPAPAGSSSCSDSARGTQRRTRCRP